MILVASSKLFFQSSRNTRTSAPINISEIKDIKNIKLEI